MKAQLLPERIANDIRMARFARHQGKSFLLVEGETDDSFYQRYVDKENCVIEVTHNKTNLLSVLDILEKANVSGILAIVDADFDILEGRQPASPNLLFTDTHDLETMMLKSPAFEKVLREFGSKQKISKLTQDRGKDIREILLECAMPIGYLLWVSQREDLALLFDELDFSKFIDRDELLIDKLKLIGAVKGHTFTASHINLTRRHMLSSHDTALSLEQIYDHTHDPWHVCSGHDLVALFSIGLCKAIGNYNAQLVKPDMLERILRLAFEFSHFCKTQLYQAILHWEEYNQPYLVLLQMDV